MTNVTTISITTPGRLTGELITKLCFFHFGAVLGHGNLRNNIAALHHEEAITGVAADLLGAIGNSGIPRSLLFPFDCCHLVSSKPIYCHATAQVGIVELD
jgi:hypothetical protein